MRPTHLKDGEKLIERPPKNANATVAVAVADAAIVYFLIL